MLTSIIQNPNLTTQFGHEQIQIPDCQPSLTNPKQVRILHH